MTFLVAFDDSPLSRGALRKAVEFAAPTDTPVVAVSVIPENNVRYMREKGWLKPAREGRAARAEAMDPHAAERKLAYCAARIAPGARFDPVRTDRGDVLESAVGPELRAAIRDHEATDVFVGARDPGATVRRLADGRDTEFHLYMIRRPYIPGMGVARYG
jgi:nucleotide-binding universal stress UspA family protein